MNKHKFNKIVIIGGSHSAYTAALLLLYGPNIYHENKKKFVVLPSDVNYNCLFN